jgi:hypothetical protein
MRSRIISLAFLVMACSPSSRLRLQLVRLSVTLARRHHLEIYREQFAQKQQFRHGLGIARRVDLRQFPDSGLQNRVIDLHVHALS